MPDLQPFTRVLGVPWFYPQKEPLPKLVPVRRQGDTRNSKALVWTAEQDKRIRQEYPTHNTNALAKELGRTARQVRARAASLGITKNRVFNNAQKRHNARGFTIRKNNVAMVDGNK